MEVKVEYLDLSKPGVEKAIALAKELVYHCKQYNFDNKAEIFGLALNANHVKEQAYIQGKNFEKERIASLLGLL